jgi:hypothetical protein
VTARFFRSLSDLSADVRKRLGRPHSLINRLALQFAGRVWDVRGDQRHDYCCDSGRQDRVVEREVREVRDPCRQDNGHAPRDAPVQRLLVWRREVLDYPLKEDGQGSGDRCQLRLGKFPALE